MPGLIDVYVNGSYSLRSGGSVKQRYTELDDKT
jgi:hypothetical protein